MQSVLPPNELLWEEQQRARGAQTHLEYREWRKNFVLVFMSIVLTLAAAAILAGLSANAAASQLPLL